MAKIFIFDDEPIGVDILELTFTQSGYEVNHYLTPKDGIEICQAEKPDLVITDLMFEGNRLGVDFANALHQEGVTVVMITAARRPDDLHEDIELWNKPFDLARFANRMMAIVG